MLGSGSGWWWRRWWAAAILLACALAARADEPPPEDWAQQADPVFTRAITRPLSVTALAQDRTGWLWLGTQNGLGRWDGQRLHLYVGDLQQPGALPDSFVLALHVDPDGTLWIGTGAGGLVRYDARAERFVSPLAAGAALSRHTVSALLSAGGQRLWVGTSGGLDLLDTRSGALQPHARLAGPLGLPARGVHALLRSDDGALWVGTDGGLYRQPREGARFEPVALATAEGASPHVAHLTQDAARRVWIGTRSHGAFLAEPGTADARPLHQLLPSGAPRLANAAIRAMVEAGPDDMWLGTDGEGVLRVDARTGQLRRVRHHARAPGGLPDDDIFALMRDRDGLVWVASDSGLSHHAAGRHAISTWFGGDPGQAIHHENVPALLPLPDGRVLLAAGDGSVDVVHPAAGRVGRLAVDADSPVTALPPGRVLCLLREPSGDVLLGTQRGLYRADATLRRVRRLSVTGRAPTASVWALAWQDGRLWLGGLDGLWALRPQPDGMLRTEQHADGEAFDEQRITALLPAPNGVLWVGTRSGVRRLDTSTGRATRPAQDEPGRVGLPRGYISAMLIDPHGRLWVAGFGNGVRVLEPAAPGALPRVHRISQAEGLPHNGVDAIAADAEGHVWASTDGGLARIDARDFSVHSYGAADGVGIPTYWTGAGGVTAGGALLFGGSGGITIVEPRHRAPPSGPPVVAVSELQVTDEPVRRSYLSNDASNPVLLPPGRRSLLVEFAVLDYASPARNRYQYRLRGAAGDAAWQDADPVRRIAAYSHLPPGDHVLELRGARPQGPWSDAIALPLHVPPQWHETRSFQVALGLIGLLLLAALVQGRTLLLRRRQRALETLVAERTAALQLRTLELQRSQGQLEELAYADGLTGLPNRRSFSDTLRQLTETPRRPGGGFFLLLIDLDHFKQINDTHGHAAGDAVLVAIAGCLQAALREGDRVARLGGDEFAVLLPGTTDDAAAERVGRRIFDSLAATMARHPGLPAPGISIGAAAFPADAADSDALYRAADLALYRAKNAGRHRFRRFSATDQEHAPASG
jgi:diguanylate cyclase (GGDEF)-like protein